MLPILAGLVPPRAARPCMYCLQLITTCLLVGLERSKLIKAENWVEMRFLPSRGTRENCWFISSGSERQGDQASRCSPHEFRHNCLPSSLIPLIRSVRDDDPIDRPARLLLSGECNA